MTAPPSAPPAASGTPTWTPSTRRSAAATSPPTSCWPPSPWNPSKPPARPSSASSHRGRPARPLPPFGPPAPGIGYHAAVGRRPVEVQQHRLCFRLNDGDRDVVPGEGADRLARIPERVRGQRGGAVVVEVAAQQVSADEAG